LKGRGLKLRRKPENDARRRLKASFAKASSRRFAIVPQAVKPSADTPISSRWAGLPVGHVIKKIAAEP
jgi:hypothetical protein